MAENRSASSCNVLVIGSGQGGAAVAKRLSDDGVKVICLEQGGWIHPLEHPHFHPEWELAKQRMWHWSPNVRQLPEDYPVTGDTTTPLMFNAVGGSTVHYGAQWPRLKPVDFRKGTEHGLKGTIDWPITYEELEPFYDINDAEVGISGLAGDLANPPISPRYCPPIPPTKVGLKVADAFDELGWHWWVPDNAILTRPKDGRLACNACGNCASGCPRGSLGSADVTYWPAALRNGADLRTFARVERITLDKRGRADGAEYIDLRTGERHKVDAEIVVVCGNGVGTPRLLLLSAQKGHPDGLANGNGLVGTHLLLHAFAFADMWFDEPTEGHKGAHGAVVYSQEFYESSDERNFVNGFTIQPGLSYGAAAAALGFKTGSAMPWGERHREVFNEHFARHLYIAIQGEDLPVASNRVKLDLEVSDSSGLPAPHLHYELSDNDVALTDFAVERILEVGSAMGAKEIHGAQVMLPPPAFHLMGTCRMGGSSVDSVTNKYNQCWEIPNLFIADGSSMTTGGGVNPTATIGAIAVRCAEYIKRNYSHVVGQTKTPSNVDAPGF
jgi:choline dehydrogenase-like flavoprotein